MRTIFLRIALLSAIALGATGTACAQSSIPDSCICYTDAQDIRCLICLQNAPRKDSIIQTQRSIIQLQDVQLSEATELQQQTVKKLKRTRKISYAASGILALLASLFYFL